MHPYTTTFLLSFLFLKEKREYRGPRGPPNKNKAQIDFASRTLSRPIADHSSWKLRFFSFSGSCFFYFYFYLFLRFWWSATWAAMVRVKRFLRDPLRVAIFCPQIDPKVITNPVHSNSFSFRSKAWNDRLYFSSEGLDVAGVGNIIFFAPGKPPVEQIFCWDFNVRANLAAVGEEH